MAKKQHLGIKIDLSKDEVLSEQALKLLVDYYCREDEPSPQYAFARAAVAYSYGDLELAQRIYNGVANGWFMYASPVLSNAPLKDEKVKALPISCFLTYVPDSLEGLIDHSAELRWLSVKGGGVGRSGREVVGQAAEDVGSIVDIGGLGSARDEGGSGGFGLDPDARIAQAHVAHHGLARELGEEGTRDNQQKQGEQQAGHVKKGRVPSSEPTPFPKVDLRNFQSTV